MRDAIAMLVLFWVGFLLCGPLARRSPGARTAYVLVATFSWWVSAAGVTYGLGPVTSTISIAVVIGGVVQLLLLPQRTAWVGIAFGMSLVVASLAAVASGVIPYAPMMTEIPVSAGRIELAHLLGGAMASVGATLALLGVVQYIMTRWRDAHAHLAQLNANLERIVEERTRSWSRGVAAAAGREDGGDRPAGRRIAHDFNNLLAVITGTRISCSARTPQGPLAGADGDQDGGGPGRAAGRAAPGGRPTPGDGGRAAAARRDRSRDGRLARPLVGEDVSSARLAEDPARSRPIACRCSRSS
jgi:hypothetical protein